MVTSDHSVLGVTSDHSVLGYTAWKLVGKK
jgi:hypothetical protein